MTNVDAPLPVRVIPRLEVKGEHVVKGMRMEGLRRVGRPFALARRYAQAGADEILFTDIVASLYNRNNLRALISEAAAEISLPLTVGGGVRTVDDFREILRSGADKVSVNTQAVADPAFVSRVAEIFGAQSVVASVQCKARDDGGWEAYTLNGRERSGRDAVAWARDVVARGAGELLLTSVDRDGTRKGPDLDLVRRIVDVVEVPVLVGGGVGSVDDCVALAKAGVSGVVVAHMLHFERTTIAALKGGLRDAGVAVRQARESAS